MSDQPTTPSPCTGVCQLAPETGFCLGCLRTGEEIAAWRGANDAMRLEILETVKTRRAAGFKIVQPTKTKVIG